MKRVIYHAVIPAMMPLLFFAVAATPVHVFGGRGLIALAVTLVSAIGAIVTAVLSVLWQKAKRG
ncbi:MAG: hypothetical protein K4571_14260 [Deltaproteobacteria bacterium]